MSDDLLNAIEENCWSVVCDGDEESFGWFVVSHFMEKPFKRIVGFSSEEMGIKPAIQMALKTTSDDPYASLGEFKG